MGCTASTNTAVVTTLEPKSSKATLVTKKPLPPIGGAADTSKSGNLTSRSRVDPLPGPSVKIGKVTNNVAFDIPLGENSIDSIVKRAPPKRLARLQPIAVTLTAEQLAEKQRIAEAKRNKIKQNIRIKSARSSRRRSDLQKALEAAKAQEEMEGGVGLRAAEEGGEMAEDPAVATPRPGEGVMTSRMARQMSTLPSLNEQSSQDDQSLKSPNTQAVPFDENKPLRPASAALMAMDGVATATSLKSGFNSARLRSPSPLEHANALPKSARSEVLAQAETTSVAEDVAFAASAASATAISAAAIKAKQLDSEAEDEDADLGVGLHDDKPATSEQQKPVAASSDTARLGSAESGFMSTVHSAEAKGKKPLEDSEIEAFKSARAEASPLVSPKPALPPKIVSPVAPARKERSFISDDDLDDDSVSDKVASRAGDDDDEVRPPSIKDDDDDIF